MSWTFVEDENTFDPHMIPERGGGHEKIGQLRDMLESELEGLAVFEQVQQYMVIEACIRSGQELIDDHKCYKAVLEHLIKCLDQFLETPHDQEGVLPRPGHRPDQLGQAVARSR